jgi:hypothetical protein
MMNRALFVPCLLLLSACSAEIAIETEPFDQPVPVTSVLQPVYAEVALDLPEESVNTEDLEIEIEEVAARLIVVNPSDTLTLRTSARLSFTGRATPDAPLLYSDINRPAYYNTAAEILPVRDFAPNSRTPVRIHQTLPRPGRGAGGGRAVALSAGGARPGGCPAAPTPSPARGPPERAAGGTARSRSRCCGPRT